MNDILTRILATKATEVAAAQNAVSLAQIKDQARAAAPVRDFIGAIRARHAQGQAALIAEVKKASPSTGLIRPDFNPAAIARHYQTAGAACLSVLTDETYFQGSEANLKAARAATDLPVLRKDFIVDPYQIYQARAWGADAVLLIAAALSAEQLQQFETVAHELGMAVLLELHRPDEWAKCSALTTPLVGVNNRDLRSFSVDLQHTVDLLPLLAGKIVVTESGIGSLADVEKMRAHGVHSFLIGETFMRADDIEAAVHTLFPA